MNPIIFLWSHPRSMSTVIERVMRELGDLKCLHEHFLQHYYLQKKKKQLAHFEAESGPRWITWIVTGLFTCK